MSSQAPIVPLGEICQFVGGGTPARNRPDYFQGDIPWATVKDFKTFRILDTEEHISPDAVANCATNVVEPGTVLLVTRVGLGKVAITDRSMAINQDIKALLPRPGVSSEYLFWFLVSRAPHIKRMGVGATVKGVTLQDVRAISMPVPSESEQSRIVDILSRAENIVRMCREAEAKTKEIIPALFIDMFGDPSNIVRRGRGGASTEAAPVGRLGDALVAAEYGTSTKATSEGAGVAMIRMGNLNMAGKLDLLDLKYVPLSPADTFKYALRPGDILFNRTNSKELVGKTGIWRGEMEAVAASYFIRLRVDTAKLVPDFVWAFMNSGHMKKTLFGMARGAIGQSNINAQELRSIQILLPDLDQQRVFSNHVQAAIALEKQQEAATEHAALAFQSVLEGVFGGGG